MPKWCHDDVMDAKHQYIADNCDAMRICTSDVLTGGVGDYAKCTGISALTGDVAMTGVDFTFDDGDVSGRKTIVAAKSAIPVTADGDAAHVVLLDTVNSKVLWITTCPTRTLTNGNDTSVPAWDIEDRDPA